MPVDHEGGRESPWEGRAGRWFGRVAVDRALRDEAATLLDAFGLLDLAHTHR